MTYQYTNKNLLESPEKYMYSDFEGRNLFKKYFQNREEVMKKYREDSVKLFNTECSIVQRALQIIKENLLNEKNAGFENLSKKVEELVIDIPGSIKNVEPEKVIKSLHSLDLSQEVSTSTLLNSLIELVILDKKDKIIKFWIDLLVQRFEVTKKLYESYRPGFRKGNGDNTLIKLYWKFALLLVIHYTRSEELKYLNTLIKICDLITSLPIKGLNQEISEYGLDLLLLSEITFVKNILKNKGIEYGHE